WRARRNRGRIEGRVRPPAPSRAGRRAPDDFGHASPGFAMFNVGAVGNGLMFFFSAVGAMVVGLWVLSYAAHSFLVVLEGTAAGDDEPRWPDEPMFDWVWKF